MSVDQLPHGVSRTGNDANKRWFVGSIDQGTTSTRFLIFNSFGEPVASHQIEFKNYHSHPG